MALIDWNDSFSVNISEIDDQHKRLVGFINDIAEAMKTGKGKAILGGILNELVDYTVYHFKTEEDYFEQFGYEETESHKKEHTDFVEKVSAFKKEFEAGNQFFSVELMSFLSSWLQDHIKGTDKEYSKFLHDKIIK